MAIQPFLWGRNGEQLTPEQVARERERAAAAAMRSADTSPVGHWSAGATRLVDALSGVLGERRADSAEASGLASADEFIQGDPVLSALLAGDQVAPQGVQAMSDVLPGGVPQPLAGTPQIAAQPGPADLVADPGIANYFAAARQAESGGNDAAKNPLSSATGRYQFIKSTWDGLRRQYPELGLTEDGRTDPAQQERAMQRFTADNASVLQNAGIPVNGGSLYAAHFLGAGGATNILSQPDNASVAALAGEGVVKANPFLANMTVGDFKNWAAKKGGGSAPVTDFAPAPQQGPSPVVGALAQASGNPWVQQKYGRVIDAMMQQSMGRDDAAYKQQLAQQDPMYQAQLQQQQLQNEALMNPAAPEPVFQGGQWWDISSGQPQPLTQAQADQTAAQQNYEFMISQGMDPQTAMDRAFSGGTTVNVGGEGMPGLGKLSADYGYVMDPATGQPVIDPSTGLPQAAPVPGSPAAQQIQAEEQMAAGQDELNARTANVVLEDIGRAKEQAEGSMTTGFLGGQLSGVPGSAAHDLQQTLATVQANIGFDRLQQMREASPTGGALGAISERELSTLQAVMGSLAQSQTKEQLLHNLDRLENIYQGIMLKASSYPNASQFGFDGADQAVQEQAKRLRYNPSTGEFE